MSKAVFLISHQADLSGAPLSLYHLAEVLKQRRHYSPIFIVPSQGPILDKLNKSKIRTITLSGIRLLSLGINIMSYKPALLHVNTVVNWPAALVGRLCGVPVVWHIREDLDGHPLLIKFIMKISSQVIVISKHVRDYFPYNYWAHISVVYNAVNPQLFSGLFPDSVSISIWKQIKAVFVKDALAGRKIIRIGFVGSIEPRKGVKELIEAIDILKKSHPQILLSIVGRVLPVAKVYHRKLLKYCSKQKLNSMISWQGKVDRIEEHMSNLDILVVPSLAEPFGRVVIEGMAAGTIVIASSCGGIPEIIADKQTGFLVEPGNPGKLAKVMIEVMNMGVAERVDVIRRARQIVIEKFLMPRQVSEIEKIYEDVLNRHE